MNRDELQVHSQITFLYYPDLDPIAEFYQGIMGFELVEDQGWAKVYAVNGSAFVGIVDGKRGFHKPQAKNAVLVTLAVNDVFKWYDYLKSKGAKILTEVGESKEIQVRGFFLEDPGGYTLEIQQFLRPSAAQVFHK